MARVYILVEVPGEEDGKNKFKIEVGNEDGSVIEPIDAVVSTMRTLHQIIMNNFGFDHEKAKEFMRVAVDEEMDKPLDKVASGSEAEVRGALKQETLN